MPQVVPTDPDANDVAWFNSRWRPAMAWQYLAVCLFDFMIAPILMGIYSAYTGEYHAWDPLTIRGGGLYHLAMGAVVGVAVWTRGREKMQLLNTFGSFDSNTTGDSSASEQK